MVRIRFLGHAGFLIEDLLIDPFITGNPVAGARVEDLRCSVLCVTHAHHDHLGDALEIALANSSILVSTPEVVERALAKGVKAERMNTGGEIEVKGWRIKMVEAVHSTAAGHAAGFVLTGRGRRIYHGGDTALFSDMRLIGEEGIDIAMLPIGGRYTMDVNDALRAVEMLSPEIVIPMHYNTFPAVRADAEDFRRRCVAARVVILEPGEEKEL